MNVKELLDTDVDVMSGWFRQAYEWWLEEIAQLAPRRLRDRLKPKATAIAWTDSTRLELRGPGGEALSTPARRVAVVLAPALTLVRRLELPAMRLGDVKKLVENEIDRLTPFRKEDVWYDVQLEGRNEAGGTQAVALGVLPRDTAENVNVLLAHAGLEAQSMQGEGGRFDFLPAMRSPASGLLQPKILWLVVAALFLVNIVFFVVRDVHQLDNLREITASQGAVVDLARRLREKVDAETTARTALLAQRARTAPLPILARLTQLLPHDAWVQKLDWDGRVLHLSGYAASPRDVMAALAKLSPRLKANIASGGSGDKQPFDVTLDMGSAP